MQIHSSTLNDNDVSFGYKSTEEDECVSLRAASMPDGSSLYTFK